MRYELFKDDGLIEIYRAALQPGFFCMLAH